MLDRGPEIRLKSLSGLRDGRWMMPETGVNMLRMNYFALKVA